MKKMTMLALSLITLTSLSACATTETSGSVAKTEAPQAVETKAAEAPKAADAQRDAAQPETIGKRGLKLPSASNAETGKPADKAGLCVPGYDPVSQEVRTCN